MEFRSFSSSSKPVVVIAGAFLLSCGAKMDTYPTPFEKAGHKVLVRTELRDRGEVPTGTSLAVLVDETCLRTHKLENGLRDRLINLDGGVSPQKTMKLMVAGGTTWKQLEKTAAKDPCLLGISESLNFKLSSSSAVGDPLLEKQTYLKKLQILEGQKAFYGQLKALEMPVVIAMIDSGIFLQHQDLAENLWNNEKEKTGLPGIDDDGNGYIDDVHGFNFASRKGDPSHEGVDDHGTHTAGLAAAVGGNGLGISGMMGRFGRLMILNVTGKMNGAETIHIDEAIRYAADNGADVINVSISGPGEGATTAAAIAYALKKNVVVVVSAGNAPPGGTPDDIDKTPYTPSSYAAQYPGLISVAAVDSIDPGLCDNSNYGVHSVKIAAAGCDKTAPRQGVLSTREKNQYGYKKGTSMASPLVAGAAAFIVGAMKGKNQFAYTPAQVEKILLDRCEVRPELNNFVYGGCQLNLARYAR